MPAHVVREQAGHTIADGLAHSRLREADDRRAARGGLQRGEAKGLEPRGVDQSDGTSEPLDELLIRDSDVDRESDPTSGGVGDGSCSRRGICHVGNPVQRQRILHPGHRVDHHARVACPVPGRRRSRGVRDLGAVPGEKRLVSTPG